jgi:hypothetical protein
LAGGIVLFEILNNPRPDVLNTLVQLLQHGASEKTPALPHPHREMLLDCVYLSVQILECVARRSAQLDRLDQKVRGGVPFFPSRFLPSPSSVRLAAFAGLALLFLCLPRA